MIARDVFNGLGYMLMFLSGMFLGLTTVNKFGDPITLLLFIVCLLVANVFGSLAHRKA